MGSPLGCLLGFVLAIFVFVGVFLLTIVGRVRSFLAAMNPNSKKKQHNNQSRQNNSRQNTASNGRTSGRSSSSHQKIFADDEGEYIDYEEIK